MSWNLSFFPLVTSKHLTLKVFRLAQEDGHMTGKWEMAAENQMLGFQNYPALTSKKSKVENTTRKILDTKDSSSLSTDYTL